MANDKVTQILVDRILKTVERDNKLPWQKPWEFRYAFNWYSGNVYRGINRWLLPAGEYMTRNQLNEYNKKKGTSYRFLKGIEWFPVLFVKEIEAVVYGEELESEPVQKLIKNNLDFVKNFNYTYYRDKTNGNIIRKHLSRRYYEVADIQWFGDENGNKLVSKIQSGEVEFCYENPDRIINNYIKREKVSVTHAESDRAYYNNSNDSILIPEKKQFKSIGEYYVTLFHELAHSTGIETRLNRKSCYTSIKKIEDKDKRKSLKAYEEVIAEMTACLLCVETGIFDIPEDVIYDKDEFENAQIYIDTWYKRIKSGELDMVYIASDAEKAFKYIIGDNVHEEEEFIDKMQEE